MGLKGFPSILFFSVILSSVLHDNSSKNALKLHIIYIPLLNKG